MSLDVFVFVFVVVFTTCGFFELVAVGGGGKNSEDPVFVDEEVVVELDFFCF